MCFFFIICWQKFPPTRLPHAQDVTNISTENKNLFFFILHKSGNCPCRRRVVVELNSKNHHLKKRPGFGCHTTLASCPGFFLKNVIFCHVKSSYIIACLKHMVLYRIRKFEFLHITSNFHC